MEIEIIDDFAAVRFLINTYMIKQLKNAFRPVNQEMFIQEVYDELMNKGCNYTDKQILLTWKDLLDNYQYYKQNFTDDDARKAWKYFDLMDKCFDTSKANPGKFDDHKWILFLLESLKKFKPALMKHDFTMDMLQEVEDDFIQSGNYEINQKDIYNEWYILKNVYQKYLSAKCKINKDYSYYRALKEFFEKDETSVSQNELDTAIDSIKSSDGRTGVKRRKVEDNKASQSSTDAAAPFTAAMHDILLQVLKRNVIKIRNSNGQIDDDTLNEIHDEYSRLGYSVLKPSIRNEWNDLSCRYELIKNSEDSRTWPYFDDLDYIYNEEEDCYSTAQNSPRAESEYSVSSLLRNSQKISNNNLEISERLLNIYECNNREFLEIKDILIERNLLREETNYLLNIFAEKFNNRKK